MSTGPAPRRLAQDGIALGELAATLGGICEGEPETRIFAAAGIEDAGPGSIVRVEKAGFLERALSSAAGALLLPPELDRGGRPCIRVGNVRLAFLRCLELFSVEDEASPGVHATAVIGAGGEIDATASVGPYAVLGRNVVLGPRAVVHAHAVLGDDVEVGAASIIYPNAVLYARSVIGERVRIHAGAVIGADGFGYEWTGARHQKRPHNGRVVIADDVEIGANTTIDRATSGQTFIGPDTKIDNLVMVGHNCHVGAHCIVVSQTGVSGSVVLGDGVVLGGQVGINPNVAIGSGTKVGGKAAVWGDLPPGTVMSGIPAQNHREELRLKAALRRVPELLARLRNLEIRLASRDKGETR